MLNFLFIPTIYCFVIALSKCQCKMNILVFFILVLDFYFRYFCVSLPSDLELKPVGMLEVKLVQAKNLTNKDLVGKSDPFAKMFIRPLREKTQRSKTIVSSPSDYLFVLNLIKNDIINIYSHQNNDLNPIWNEHFEFVVEDASTQHLVVRIYDDEGVQASELIGCAQIRLCELEPGKVKDVWLKLVKDLEIQIDNKNRGEVR